MATTVPAPRGQNSEFRMHPTRTPGQACKACGFEPTSVSPSDAIVAIRSFPRRFRKLLQEALLDLDRGEDIVRHRPGGSWSALEITAHTRDALHVFDKRMQRLVTEDGPSLAEAELEVRPTSAHEQGAELVLASLLTTADELGRAAAKVSGDDWTRTGALGETQVSALDVLREAVHEGAHHLRDVEQVLREADAEIRGR